MKRKEKRYKKHCRKWRSIHQQKLASTNHVVNHAVNHADDK